MKRPLTGLVVAYALGIWVGSWLNWASVWLCGVLVVACFRWPKLVWAAVFCAGLVAFQFSTINAEPNHITRLLSPQDQDVTLRGVVMDAPSRSFRLRLTGEMCGTILMFGNTPASLRYGDEIECTAVLRVPLPSTNPGTFDWQRWLARRNIQFTALVRAEDECRIVARDRGNPVIALALRLRAGFERALRVGLEGQPRLAGVLAGMVIGERAEIPEDTYADFQQTGVFHVFAISGLHVGIVTIVVVTVLRLAQVPRRWCGLVAIPLLVLYVFATGARPGAVRALVMACVWLGGWLLVRPTDMLSNLAAAALLILVVTPTTLFDGGFVLSFAVVLALVVLAPKFEEALMPGVMPDELVPEELVPVWRKALIGPGRWAMRLICCSLAAWVGLLPLMAVYFNLFTTVSLLANVIVIPLVGVIIPIGMGSAMVPAVAATLNNANFFLLEGMIGVIDWLNQWPGGHWFIRTPPVWLTVAYYGVLGLIVARSLKLRWLVLPVGLFVGVLAWPERAVEVSVLNLRDGRAVFVNMPGEENDWLIDGGGGWDGDRVVVPFLRAQGVDRLAGVILTRNDKAHAAGLCAVTEVMPVGEAIHSGTGSRSRFFWEWLTGMRQRQLKIATLRAGDAGPVGMRVLHPPQGTTAARSDDNALVLLLEYGPTRVLLTSDIGESVEKELAVTPAQVLIKGRHGKESSGTDGLLDAVRPEVVIQSVGVWRGDHHPESDLAERVRARGGKFFRTDESGAVTVRLTAKGYTIRTCVAGADAAR